MYRAAAYFYIKLAAMVPYGEAELRSRCFPFLPVLLVSSCTRRFIRQADKTLCIHRAFCCEDPTVYPRGPSRGPLAAGIRP